MGSTALLTVCSLFCSCPDRSCPRSCPSFSLSCSCPDRSCPVPLCLFVLFAFPSISSFASCKALEEGNSNSFHQFFCLVQSSGTRILNSTSALAIEPLCDSPLQPLLYEIRLLGPNSPFLIILYEHPFMSRDSRSGYQAITVGILIVAVANIVTV